MSKRIILFIVTLLVFSWAIAFFIHFFGLNQNSMAIVMILPLVLVLVCMLSSRQEKFSSIGWRIPHFKYILLGIFLPLVQIGFVLSAGWALNLISFNHQHTLVQKPTPYVWLNVLICIPAMFIPFILLGFPRFLFGWLSHLGEEIAWRGYLFKKIAVEQKNLQMAVVISGAVWWAWHVPMFLFSPILNKLSLWPLALTAAMALFSLVGTSFIYSWIYIKSGSIWTPTIMHLFWNLFRGILTGRLADGEPGIFTGNLWLINGEGIIGMVIAVLFGLIFYLLMRRTEQNKEWP
jgi:membrane protease YdiL (CAAX protease family)